MNVLALSRTSRRGPSTRYRIEQYRDALRDHGIEVAIAPLFGDAWFAIRELRPAPWRALVKAGYSVARLFARVGQVLAARRSDADAILVEQQLFPYLPGVVEAWLWPRGKPTLLEFDDAIFLTFAHRAKLERLCGLADVVIVGNEFLAEFARPHARRVVVVPTTVDAERYRGVVPADAPPPPGTLRVGWIGLPYNFASLEQVVEPLRRLAADGVDCELRVISSHHPTFDAERWRGVRVVPRTWTEDTEASELAACSVGIMPIPDTDWSRGKCGLKLLQSKAAGLPVIGSRIGVNREIIEDGRNGMLAADDDEWERAFRIVVEEPDRAARMGAAGRASVEQRYSIERGARSLAETYRLATRTGDPTPADTSDSAHRPRSG